MITLLTTLFIILCIFLALFIFLQQGKGDLGMNSLGSGGQMLFGGSGGQNFFERATWLMGLIFVVGSLGLTILQSKYRNNSELSGFSVQRKAQATRSDLENQATTQENTQETSEKNNQEIDQEETETKDLLELDGDDE